MPQYGRKVRCHKHPVGEGVSKLQVSSVAWRQEASIMAGCYQTTKKVVREDVADPGQLQSPRPPCLEEPIGCCNWCQPHLYTTTKSVKPDIFLGERKPQNLPLTLHPKQKLPFYFPITLHPPIQQDLAMPEFKLTGARAPRSC